MNVPAAAATCNAGRRAVFRCVVVLIATVSVAGACVQRTANRAPHTEFIVAAGDSSYWVRSDASGISLRGSPLVLARLDGRFLELYVEDDDHSFEDAVFIGQRLYERDIVSGDSIEIFHDTVVPTLADRYEKSHPDAQPLGPDEEPKQDPSITATADVTVLGVHGPFLSVEYQIDTSGQGDDTWRTTRHAVIDLRTGTPATLKDVIGPVQAETILRRARRLYVETLDSLRRDPRPLARRAARAIGHFRFDPNSFSITAPNGTIMIAFSAPGQGTGGEGFVLPLRPIPVVEPDWWRDVRRALPASSREREEDWSHGNFYVRAAYDTTSGPVRLSLVDSTHHEYAIGGVSAPVHRIYWLDEPRLDTSVRTALTRAFDEAASYDDETRATASRPGTVHLAAMP